MMDVIQWILVNGPVLLQALGVVLGGLIAIAVVIPGEQPEKFLQSLVDLIAKISRK